ncbi:TetR/AcrR family transcriptional regulator [Nesterenkonia pannonica]|uniref:TetR/AcrR family transcriptional regulator n=1 Tax=Nesterenkonia pannonica TaxID=1548602 RepID=UPI00216493D3|nr:TetR/AcrR family transcriptional regulator [Nesterenkonia pannonica]
MSTAGRLSARDRLLRAADSLLFQRGIRVTAVDDVLREADVSTASLYTHFGSKDALTAEVLRIRFADWQAIWDRCAAVAVTDEARLLSVFDALAEYRESSGHASRWCAFLAAAHELGDAAPEVTPILAEERELLTSRLLHFSRPLAGSARRSSPIRSTWHTPALSPHS